MEISSADHYFDHDFIGLKGQRSTVVNRQNNEIGGVNALAIFVYSSKIFILYNIYSFIHKIFNIFEKIFKKTEKNV